MNFANEASAFVRRFHARRDLPARLDRQRSLSPLERAADRDEVERWLTLADRDDRALVDAFIAQRASVDAFALLASLAEHPLDDSPHLGDEPLDAFVEALLGTYGRYDGGASPGPEMIHYDPSPATAALVLAKRGWFGRDEVFVDLGSGTGRVATLASLLGSARVVGVEIDEDLVAIHRAAASRLGLAFDVRVGDARQVPFEDGTGFFFFAPFLGSVLDAVLARLRTIAAERPIRVGSWGPSTEAIARADFLVPDRDAPYGPFDLATFRAGPEG